MKTNRRVEITIETNRVLVIRKGAQSITAWCAGCASDVEMVTADEAALRAGISLRSIYSQVESGKLHFIETPGNALFICLNSLG